MKNKRRGGKRGKEGKSKFKDFQVISHDVGVKSCFNVVVVVVDVFKSFFLFYIILI